MQLALMPRNSTCTLPSETINASFAKGAPNHFLHVKWVKGKTGLLSMAIGRLKGRVTSAQC
eukprot:2120937-Karenia_brevis.AAC.1